MKQSSPDPDAIARELAELGEEPASAEELALIEAGTLEQQPAVASMARLSELAEPYAFDELSELETHRAWRKLEQRVEQDQEAEPRVVSEPEPAAGPASPRRWLFALAGLAAAAAVALIVVPGEGEGGTLSAEDVAKQGESVRVALDALDDGRSDSTRARERASAYQQRLEEREG